MYGLEYSSLIIDVICGFVCLILGLLHYFDIAKPFEKVTGIIGLSTGIIGFILTLVYACYSGFIFTNDHLTNVYKTNGDLAFAQFVDSKGYKCLFYKEKDENSIYAKYNDLGKKQYNYNKKKSQEYSEGTTELKKCQYSYLYSLSPPLSTYNDPSHCEQNEYFYVTSTKLNGCDYFYIKPIESISNKYLFDRWTTTIIFSCFIIACDIGLAIFGFLLFRSDTPRL